MCYIHTEKIDFFFHVCVGSVIRESAKTIAISDEVGG